MQTKKLFSSLTMTGIRLVIFVSMLMTALIGTVTPAFAAVTGEIVPTANGNYTAWTNAYTEINEGTGAASCSSGNSVVSGTNNARKSVVISLASIPNGSTITSIDVLARDRGDSNAGGTYATFVRFNGADSANSATHAVTGSSGGCTGSRTDTFAVVPTLKGAGTTLQIGVIKLNSGSATNNAVRVGVLSAVITYTAPKLNQTISFTSTAPAAATVGGATYTPTAAATSGLAVTFTIDASASSICSIGAGVVSFQSAGSCVINANQAGNATYNAAPQVQQSFSVAVAGSGVAFDLYAVTGTTTLPGLVSSVPVWGYNTSNTPVTKPGGPTLVVNQNDVVTITLHNQLSENTALLFQGMSMIPDTTGASAGGTKIYTFTASKPGTFLYEAGLIPGKQHQVAMGLYGALIVRPTGAPLQAYAGANTAFITEQVLVLSELDTALNAAPATFDMRKFSPKYYLINGEVHPDTDLISVTAGNKVLLRYVDAGLQAHAMSTLGLSQTLVGQDGNPMTPHAVVSETIAPGQTLDAIVTIPGSAAVGAQYPLYDASLFLRNNKGTAANAGLGGMLTFLTVGTSAPPVDTGPFVTALALSPNPTGGSAPAPVTVTATISDAGTVAVNNIAAAEFYIDSTAGTAYPMTADSALDSATESFTSASPISTALLQGLASGNHTIYVRGRDSLNNWSPFLSITLNLDKSGPATSGLTLTPNPSSGAVSVDLAATGSDTASGNSNVTAAEYWVDAGAPIAMTAVGAASPTRNFTATIPSGLAQGTHVVSVRSQDSFGNWGATATIDLQVSDTAGPATSNVLAVHNPNNGTLPFNTSVLAVRVTADFSDVATGNSNLTNAEGFLDTYNASLDGTGFVFIANDGNFNSPAESGYSDIPLPVVNALSTGNHPICVHAKDASGNWGPINCATNLTIDHTAPTVSSINRADANPAFNGSVHFTVTFSEAVTGVTGSNFTIVRTGLSGTSNITSVTGGGSVWTVTATTGTGTGTLGLNLTSTTGITDLASNALSATLPVVGQVYNIVPPPQPSLYFSTTGNTNPLGVGGTADDADIYFYNTSTSAFTRSIDASAAPYSLPATGGGNANVDGFDRVDATHFYMSFTGTVTLPGGAGTVQDEDVVFYNAGTWTVYFDGTPGTRGLSGSDLDAISIVGTTLYFSTDDTDVPTGVSGGGDDADIYSWNGTTFARVVNASDVGWSTTNVDGLVWVDATHVYLSYSSDTTVPGSLAVQDEDVVRNNGGVWSVYFDGTALGLGTDGNLDIDAFDLP